MSMARIAAYIGHMFTTQMGESQACQLALYMNLLKFTLPSDAK